MNNNIKNTIKKAIKFFQLNLNQVKDNGLIESKKIGSGIPKIIHQIYSSEKNLSEKIKKNYLS
ncbi:MAG: hypothetical protein CTY37_07670 [Methylotenera sp.]|nr:MAG: hypothetical protein CTY37_07670 [Methylotenera sp.]PPD17135.1 MAG: hypothetical protein CTY27_04495 [Methylotenera sp.]